MRPITPLIRIAYRLPLILLALTFLILSVLPEKNIHAEPAFHPVISELQTAGVTADDEFIELYNPADQDVPLSGWSIQYKASQGSTYYKKNFGSSAVLPSHGFFLIANSGGYSRSTTTPADMPQSTFSMSSTGGTIYLVSSADTVPSTTPANIIDKVSWGTGDDPENAPAQTPDANQSIERKATATSTADSLMTGNDLRSGNAEDTDNNSADFIIRPIPEPQNTQSLKEPLTESDDPPPSPQSPVSPTSTPLIILSEIFPNPVNEDDEFIELKNIGTTTADLTGWIIADLAKEYTITASDFTTTTTIISPNNFFVLPRSVTRIALNNTGGETVKLFNSAHATTSTISFEDSAPESQSFAYDGSSWHWTTTVTQGTANTITSPPAQRNNTGAALANPPTSSTQPNASSTSFTSSILMTELLPNPEGEESEDEFIELYNSGSTEVDIEGWKLIDASNNEYVITAEDILDTGLLSGEYIAIYRAFSHIALNNTGGETVKLLNPSGTVVYQISYQETADADTAWARKNDGSWVWTTTPTPESTNIFSPLSQSSSSTTSNSRSSSSLSPSSTSLNPLSPLSPLLFISEFLPNPAGDDTEGEWIELYNAATTTASLAGWKLDDAEDGSSPYTFPANTLIGPTSYLVVLRAQSKIAINNSDERIRLLKPDSTVKQTVTFDEAIEGQSYAYLNARWQWTDQLTPGRGNLPQSEKDELTENFDQLTSGNEETVTTSLNAQQQKSNNEIQRVLIVDLRDLPAGTTVITSGLMAVTRGTFGKTTTYIIAQDNSSGVQIYSSKGSFPDVPIGTLVDVIGTLSNNQGETRLKISSLDAFTRRSQEPMPEPMELPTGEIGEDHEGMLVSIAGTLTERKGTSLWIDDGSGHVRVYLKPEAKITLPRLTKNETELAVTGIVSETSAGYRILPRSQNDIMFPSSPVSPLPTSNLSPTVLGVSFQPERIPIPANRPPVTTALTYLSLTAAGVLLTIIMLNIKYILIPRIEDKRLSRLLPQFPES